MSFRGNRAFNKCDVRVVEFKDFVFADTGDGQTGPADDVDDIDRPTALSVNPSEDVREFAGNSAVLHCPRTEDDRIKIESQYITHGSRLSALRSVRKLAGELLCHDCRFSSMTPVDIALERAAIVRAEAERLQALALRQSAIAELNKVSPGFDYHE